MAFLVVSLLALSQVVWRYAGAWLPADARRTVLFTLPIFVAVGVLPILPKLRTPAQVADAPSAATFVLLVESVKLVLATGALAVTSIVWRHERAADERMEAVLASARVMEAQQQHVAPATLFVRAKALSRFVLLAFLYTLLNNLKARRVMGWGSRWLNFWLGECEAVVAAWSDHSPPPSSDHCILHAGSGNVHGAQQSDHLHGCTALPCRVPASLHQLSGGSASAACHRALCVAVDDAHVGCRAPHGSRAPWSRYSTRPGSRTAHYARARRAAHADGQRGCQRGRCAQRVRSQKHGCASGVVLGAVSGHVRERCCLLVPFSWPLPPPQLLVGL